MEELSDQVELPLRERLTHYLVFFAAGWAVLAIAGFVGVVWLDGGFRDAVGISAIILGVLLMAAGGSHGGGYVNLGLGVFPALFGGRNPIGDDYKEDEALRHGISTRRDPMERLRKGLRPPRNPQAFWQVVAGLAYTVAGFLLVN